MDRTHAATVSRLAMAVALAAGPACSSGGDGGGTPPTSLAVAKASPSGDAQSATVAQALVNPLRVRVTRDGEPDSGVTVTWTPGAGAGTLTPLAPATDASGIAGATWTMPQTSGAKTASASVAGASGSPVGFTATATAGPATQLQLAGGNGQTGVINTVLPTPIQVKAADQFGNGVAGVAIAWQVTSGGGSVAPGSGATAANGVASATWTLGGTVGSQAAEASGPGLTGSPRAFSATATAAPPPTSDVTVGNNVFSPGSVTVAVGTQVRWTWVNTGGVSHSVASTGSPSFPSSAILTGAGSTYSHTFTVAGVYTYECAVHGAAMSGTVTVN